MKKAIIRSLTPRAPLLRTIGSLTLLGSLMIAIPVMSMILFKNEAENTYNRRFKEFILKEFKENKIDLTNGRYSSELELSTICTKWDGKANIIPVAVQGHLLNIPGSICAGFAKAKRLDSMLYRLSFLTFIFTLLLMLILGLLGILAYRNRESLFRYFKPGLYLSQIATILLLTANLAIIILRIFALKDTGGIIAMSIGALLIVGFIAYQSFKRVTIPGGNHRGKKVSATDQPRLWQYVESLAHTMGTTPPDTIILGLEPTFFVVEAPMNLIGLKTVSKIEGKSMYLSLPYCSLLTQDELTSIIGHELAHFTGEDTAWSLKFFPIYAHAENTLLSLQKSYRRMPKLFFMITLLTFIPSYVFMKFFMTIFKSAEKKISRERELRADAIGARLTSSLTAAIALVKIYLYQDIYYFHRMILITQASMQKEFSSNFVESFTTSCKELQETPGLKESLNQEQITHPTDAHPPLLDRLKAYGISLDDVYQQAHIIPSNSAVSLLEQREEIERELTVIEAQ